jgi:hypothetical protein
MKGQLTTFFENELNAAMFEGNDIAVLHGPMVTVLGTSLQNRIYSFTNLLGSYWFRNGRFLLPKAIQSASKN